MAGARALILCVLLAVACAGGAQAAKRKYDLYLRTTIRSVDGGPPRQMITINNQMPGPVIRGRQGDDVIVRVHNQMASAAGTWRPVRP